MLSLGEQLKRLDKEEFCRGMDTGFPYDNEIQVTNSQNC